jgi:serine/threonine protein kinase
MSQPVWSPRLAGESTLRQSGQHRRCTCIASTTQVQCLRTARPDSFFCAQHEKKCLQMINENSIAATQGKNVIRTNVPLLGKPVGKFKSLTPLKTPPTAVSGKRPTSDNKSLIECTPDLDDRAPLSLDTLNIKQVEEKYGPLGGSLGSGTYGEVVRVGWGYALKRMKIQRVNPEYEGIERSSIREISTFVYIGKFSNVVSAYNVNITLASVDLLLERAPLGDLRNFYDTDLMPQDVYSNSFKSLVHQLVLGVAYLNKLDVIHRDIKPQNCLIFPNTSTANSAVESTNDPAGNAVGVFVLKIADLGLARTLVCNLGLPLTNPVYTLWYRSPEILLGSKHYNAKSDSWAAGTTIYEMAAKVPLFAGNDEPDQFFKIVDVLGSPSPDDWDIPFDNLPYTQRWRQLASYSLGTQYNRILNSRDSFSDLIRKSLIYNPNTRWSCARLLNHEYLNDGPHSAQTNYEIEELTCKQRKCAVRLLYPLPSVRSDQLKLISTTNINAVVNQFSKLSENLLFNKTGHLALFIFFSFLASMDAVIINESKMDVMTIAAACYLIASKLADNQPIRLSRVARIMNQNYPYSSSKSSTTSSYKAIIENKVFEEDILSKESDVLMGLKFNLYAVTSYDFMQEYLYRIETGNTKMEPGVEVKLEDASKPLSLPVQQIRNLTASYLAAAVPLGFEYQSDLIALASIKKAMSVIDRNMENEYFNDSVLNKKLQPLIDIISANFAVLNYENSRRRI